MTDLNKNNLIGFYIIQKKAFTFQSNEKEQNALTLGTPLLLLAPPFFSVLREEKKNRTLETNESDGVIAYRHFFIDD
jgi:hypothetical protein